MILIAKIFGEQLNAWQSLDILYSWQEVITISVLCVEENSLSLLVTFQQLAYLVNKRTTINKQAKIFFQMY